MSVSFPDFKNEISVGDLIQAVAVLIAAGGLLFSAVQTRRANRQSRIQQVIDLHGQFLNDENLVRTYYLIEYGEFEYGADFHESELERQVDRLLQSFENIAMLYEAGAVTAKELDLVAYHYLVIYQDRGIKKYFEWLDRWYDARGMDEVPFGVFRNVGSVLEKRRYKPGRSIVA